MSIEYPFVSVLVLNYNGKKYLKALFESLLETNYPKEKLEIIMGDNASADGSVEYVEQNFTFVKILRFSQNFGFCKGNNLCTKEAHGEYVVFLNTDTIVTKDWLKNLVTSVINDRTVVTAGAKLLKPSDGIQMNIIDYAGGKINFELGVYDGIFELDQNKYSIQKYTGFGCGAAVIVKTSFFTKIGGFDEYYFGGGEEVELGIRAWQYGYKVLYVPSSVVYHLRYGSFKLVNNFATYSWVKSIFYLILKNCDKKVIFPSIMESILLNHFPKLVIFVIKNDKKTFISVLRGMLDFLLELKTKKILSLIYHKREEIESNRKISYKTLVEIGVMSTFNERMQNKVKMYQNWKRK